MLSRQLNLAIVFSASLIAAPAFASHVHRSPTAGTATAPSTATHKAPSHKAAAAKKPVPKLHGQQAIEPERVTQIQTALIREHYLDGEATGRWDDTTVAAMQKFQADQGWQTKLMPDARALMKLGLGPDYSTAINARNPNSAALANKTPAETTISSLPPGQAAAFAAAAGVAQ